MRVTPPSPIPAADPPLSSRSPRTLEPSPRPAAQRCSWWPPPRHRRGRTLGAALAVVVVLAIGTAPNAWADTTVVLALAPDISTVLTNIRNWIMGILALLATVFLTVGGVRYVAAAGNPSEIEKAKSAFRSAAFGYALAALAPLVVQILSGIVGL
jgi:Type IV secretion system pilin